MDNVYNCDFSVLPWIFPVMMVVVVIYIHHHHVHLTEKSPALVSFLTHLVVSYPLFSQTLR